MISSFQAGSVESGLESLSSDQPETSLPVAVRIKRPIPEPITSLPDLPNQ